MPLLRYAPNLKYSIFYPLSNQLELFYVLYSQTKSYHLQTSLPSTILAHMNCTFSDFPRHSCLQDSCCPSHTLTPAILIATGIYSPLTPFYCPHITHVFSLYLVQVTSMIDHYYHSLEYISTLTILTDWTKPQSRYSSLCLWGNCTHIAERGQKIVTMRTGLILNT